MLCNGIFAGNNLLVLCADLRNLCLIGRQVLIVGFVCFLKLGVFCAGILQCTAVLIQPDTQKDDSCGAKNKSDIKEPSKRVVES